MVVFRLYLDSLRRGDDLYYDLVGQYGEGNVPPEYLDDKADLWGL